jgi:TonB family protein
MAVGRVVVGRAVEGLVGAGWAAVGLRGSDESRGTILRMGQACVRLLVGIVGVLVAWPACAQTDARGLEDVLKGTQLVLRSYSADKVANYNWVDGKLVDTPAEVHTLGIFIASNVKVKGQKLSISGSRAALVRDTKNNKLGLTRKSAMEIEIDLNGADTAGVLPQLRDLLFFPDVASAIAGVPPQLTRSVPASVSRQVSVDPCNCQQFLRDGEWVKIAEHDSKMRLPTLIYSENPKYTDEAMAAKVIGAVRLMMLVDAKGKATDLWLTVSQGYGLDEAAEAAVKQYRFSPALYDNQPVGVELGIDVNFNIF